MVIIRRLFDYVHMVLQFKAKRRRIFHSCHSERFWINLVEVQIFHGPLVVKIEDERRVHHIVSQYIHAR